METIKEYILTDLYELNPSQRTSDMTLDFAAWLQANHNDEYEDIVDRIDTDDFIVSLTSKIFSDTGRQVGLVQKQMIVFMDDFIDEQRAEVGADIEDAEEFGTGADAEFRRNGFASEADYNNWRHG